MAYAWSQAAESEGPQQAERIPDGEHAVRIVKIMYGSRQGAFQSKSGDPQIMLVFQDRQAREITLMLTLSDKAGFMLAKLLSACDPPANLARMEADGIEPAHFANPEFADGNLVGRNLTIQVEPGKDPRYPLVTPVPKRGDESVAPASDDSPPSADEPPPSDDLPPSAEPLTPITKDEAWKRVLTAWDGCDKDKRNAAWTDAIRGIGKPEAQLTNEDWALVAQTAQTPF